MTLLRNQKISGSIVSGASNLLVADPALFTVRDYFVRKRPNTAGMQVIQYPSGKYLRHSTSGLKFPPPRGPSKPIGGAFNASRGASNENHPQSIPPSFKAGFLRRFSIQLLEGVAMKAKIIAFPGCKRPRNRMTPYNREILQAYFDLPEDDQRAVAKDILGRLCINSLRSKK